MGAFTLVQPENIGVGLGNWSHAGVIDLRQAQRVIAISGQTSHDPSGALVGPHDLRAQFDQVFRNIQTVVEGSGATMRDIVQFRTFLTRQIDVQPFREMRDEYLQSVYGDGPYPGNSLIVVSALAKPELLLEIEVLACV